jgi:hypothetical protein
MNRRRRYRVYGLEIDSELPFASIDEISPGSHRAEIEIALERPEFFDALPSSGKRDVDEWVHHEVLPDGRIYLKAETIFQAVVSSDGSKVTCARPEGVDQRTFEANLLNFVLTASLTLRGEETLHATVVDIGGRAVGLIGRSGAGKSTLAAYLIGQGADLITDDMLRIGFTPEGAMAYPGPYRLKLFEEPARRFLPGRAADGHFNTLSGKVMMPPRNTVAAGRVARALVALFHVAEAAAPASATTARRLDGVAFARTIISAAMDDRYARPDRLIRQVEFAARVAQTIPLFELNYPRTFEAMQEVSELIRRSIEP